MATGSVAALNVPGMVDALRCRSDYAVVVLLTRAAEHFVTPDAITYGGRASLCFRDDDRTHDRESTHIWLADRILATLVYPASADFIASVAYGHGIDLATTTMLSVGHRPVLFAPAMHHQMWANPFVRENLARIQRAGYHLLQTESGISPDVELVASKFLELANNATSGG